MKKNNTSTTNNNTMHATAASVQNTVIVDREAIRKALMKLGVKSHNDTFYIGNDIDFDTLDAVASVIVGYVGYLRPFDMYRNPTVLPDFNPTDLPDCAKDAYLIVAYVILSVFDNFYRVQKFLSELIEFGMIPYGMYTVHDLMICLIKSAQEIMELDDIPFTFCFHPQNRFFDDNLGDDHQAHASAQSN